MGKKCWLSKTFWINVLALGAIIVQSQTSWVITPEKQMATLGVVNTILRFVTKSPVDWS